MYWCLDFPTLLDLHNFKINLTISLRKTVISEKLETTISSSRSSIADENISYDLWLLSEGEEFDGEVLLQAIKATFQDRNTNLPADLSEIFSYDFVAQHRTAWSAFLKKGGVGR